MASFAARDQENIINAHQQLAASKPLNQGGRALQPKTPGQKAFQTPFRARGNDENVAFTIKGGKTGLGKGGAKENIQLNVGGKGKQAAHTPAPETQARNALAPKTTNAKAKAAQTPAPLGFKQGAAPKTNQRPTSLRKTKGRNEVGQETKLRIPVDLEECPSPEIENIYPRPPDMEDFDDDFPPLDLSLFDPAQGGIDADQLPYLMLKEQASAMFAREAELKKERDEILELRTDAAIIRNSESHLEECFHEPECPNGECKDWPEQLRKAEEKYQKVVSSRLLPEERAAKGREAKEQEAAHKSKTVRAMDVSKGPSDAASRRAASALSMASRPESAQPRPISRDYEKPWLVGSRAAPAPAGYASKHAASVTASKSTLGFRKGRTAIANMKGLVLPRDENGNQIGSKPMVTRKSDLDTLQELYREAEERKSKVRGEGPKENEAGAVDYHLEEAEQDFVLTLE